MKTSFVIAGLVLAAVCFAIAPNSAKAGHHRAGYRYGGNCGVYRPSCVGAPVYAPVPRYNCGYRGYDDYYGGRPDHRYGAPYLNSGYGPRGYGNHINVITPDFGFGLGY